MLLADRKIWAAVQLRRGPNVVGPFGLFQSFADLLKFVFKEPIIPAGANKARVPACPAGDGAFWRCPPGRSCRSADGWVIANINVGILYIFAISSLEVYGIIMGGWASNSKYPFLGALRSAAQMVSYEVSIGFVIVTVLLCVGSLNLTDIVNAQHTGLGTMLGLPGVVPRLALAVALPDVHHLLHFGARRNEPPALRPSGSGIGTRRRLHGRIRLLALHDVHARRICGHLPDVRADDDPVPRRLAAAGRYLDPQLGPGHHLVPLKVCFVFFMFAMVKAFVPRYRYDQLMRLGWKVFLPLSLAMVVIVAFVLKLMGWA